MATDHCFDITSARDYYEKLLVPAVDEFRKDILSSRKGLTAAIYLWQFPEWVVQHHLPELAALPAPIVSLNNLRNHITGI